MASANKQNKNKQKPSNNNNKKVSQLASFSIDFFFLF